MRLTLVFLLGVVVSAAFLNATIFYLPIIARVAIALVFMGFATGMIFSMAQFFTNAAFGIFEILNWRYKVVKTHDAEADRIAEALGAPKPKSINITENPRVIAVTNAWTGTITISRRLTKILTRAQLLAVITHEIGHLKHRKSLLAEIGLAMLTTTAFSLHFLNIIILISPTMGILAEWAFLLLVLIPILRYNELRADRETKQVGLSGALAEALEKLDHGKDRDNGSETHPSTTSRIAKLFTPVSPITTAPRGPKTGLLDRIADVNWDIHFTTPKRYRVNGIRDHILDYCKASGKKSLNILDVGCSTGVAAKKMKKDLARAGIQARVTGVDLSESVRKRAIKNLDEFRLVDILSTEQKDLSLYDVVICSYAAIFVTGDRRYGIIKRCAEQLSNDGILITNALPFRPRKVPTPAGSLRHQLGAIRSLPGGWTTFTLELRRRKADMAKRWTTAIVGREAALKFAVDIRTSWEALSEKKKEAWKRSIVISGWDLHVKRLLTYLLKKARNMIEVAH